MSIIEELKRWADQQDELAEASGGSGPADCYEYQRSQGKFDLIESLREKLEELEDPPIKRLESGVVNQTHLVATFEGVSAGHLLRGIAADVEADPSKPTVTQVNINKEGTRANAHLHFN